MNDYNKMYVCPYCGFQDRLLHFRLNTATGLSKKAFRCPCCDEKIKSELLINEYSPYEWGLWIYLSIRKYNTNFWRFYDRVHFDKLKINLELLGYNIRHDFWEGWNYGKQNYNSAIQTFEWLEEKVYGKKLKQAKFRT